LVLKTVLPDSKINPIEQKSYRYFDHHEKSKQLGFIEIMTMCLEGHLQES
jgi:hypothetical protein